MTQLEEMSIPPTEKDYSKIKFDQKYCASIFFRGLKLKSQTLYRQFMWFKQFEANVIGRMDSNHIMNTQIIRNGSSGYLEINCKGIKVKYEVIDDILYLSLSGNNSSQFIERNTQIGFDYGTINQSGVTVRSRKLQSWGFLDFVKINKKSPHDQRIFEVDLKIYQDYRDRIYYIIDQKKSWLRYAFSRKRGKSPKTWSDKNRSANWVRATINIKSIKIRDFYLKEISQLKGNLDIKSLFERQREFTINNRKANTDLVLDMVTKNGQNGTINLNFTKQLKSMISFYDKSLISNNSYVKQHVSTSDTVLAQNGLKRIEVDNENRGATKIFTNYLKFAFIERIKKSPLLKYRIITKEQYKKCKFELKWGLREIDKYERSYTFAPDVVITNGKQGKNRVIYAVIQIKGQTKDSTIQHPTAIFYQLLEMKRYELYAGIKTAMVVIDINEDSKCVEYDWLVFNSKELLGNEGFFSGLKSRKHWLNAVKTKKLDPLFPRNARTRTIAKSVFEDAQKSQTNPDELLRHTLQKIATRILEADYYFSEFTSSKSLKSELGEELIQELIISYLESIKDIIRNLIDKVQSKNIPLYHEFQREWNNRIYERYFNDLQSNQEKKNLIR
ncbi:MAG: hypothetical protein ACXADW_10100 [Candidatus Hodarchaeales archaeon]